MKFINLRHLHDRLQQIRQEYRSSKPFHFVVIDDFFEKAAAEDILNHYPDLGHADFKGMTYLDQKFKFDLNKFEQDSVMQQVFDELNAPEFVEWLQQVTEIESPLISDEGLFGAGLHLSKKGGYLNIHVDYNRHPETGYHRRVNALIYMNPDWKEEYEGHLELWDLTNGSKRLMARISPTFNRCVVFETNEISFHGHPKPLNTPENISRKSLAAYYYTQSRPDMEIADVHSTIYVNTEGLPGTVKRMHSAVIALLERLNRKS